MSDKTKIVFLDIETTGLDPRKHEILEVGMIKRTQPFPGADINLHFALRIDETRASEKALEVNRYHERRSELDAITVADHVAGRLLVTTLQDAIVVGNNPQFDLRFIEQFLRECGEDAEPWFYHPVDLKALVAGRLNMGAPPWSTKAVARESGVPLTADAHSAWADAAWNRDVYDAVMNYEPTRCTCGVEMPRRRYSLIGGVSENFHPEDH